MTGPTAPAGGFATVPGWLKIVLVLSLALNVAVAGLYLGRSTRPEVRLYGSDQRIARIVAQMPESRKAEAAAYLAEKRKDIQALRPESRKVREEWLAAVKAEPYSLDSAKAAINRRVELSMKRRQIVYDAMAEFLAKMTPAERAAYADALSESMARWRKRREARDKARERD